MSQAVVVVTPQDRIGRFIGKNWKTVTGGVLMIGAAIAQNQHWITPELANEITKAGAGLATIGAAHKFERYIEIGRALLAAQAQTAVNTAPSDASTPPPPYRSVTSTATAPRAQE